MRNNLLKILKFLSKNHYLQLTTGLILILSGINEILEEIERVTEHNFGSHHGVILIGLVTFLKALSEIAEGSEYFETLTVEAKANEANTNESDSFKINSI